MDLPQHKQDLLDLQAQIGAKLKALEIPPAPPLKIGRNELNNQLKEKPDLTLLGDLNLLEVSFMTQVHTSARWRDGTALTGWSTADWEAITILDIRIKKESKKSVPVEFTTYIKGISQLNFQSIYEIILPNGNRRIAMANSWYIQNTEFTHYRELGVMVR